MIPASEEFATVVWSQLWQVTLLILAIGLLARLYCRNKPHLAYLLWMLVVLKCLTPPLWSSPTGLFSWMQAEETTQLAATEMADSKPPEPMEFEMFDESLLVADESVSEAAVMTAEPMTLPEILAGVWLLGVVLLTVVVTLKWIRLHRKLKQTTIPVDAELLSLVSRLKQTLGIRRSVQVLVTSEPVGPAVFGFLRPVVVLPQSLLAELSDEAIEPIVAHELVHVRRWDSPAGLLQAVAQLVWWFHPLVWWANRQTSRERERCCDEEVVTGLGCLPTFYARSLLDVLELKRRLRSIFAFPGIRPVEITSKRVEDIMQRSDHFHRRTPRWCWGVIFVSAALILPGAGLVFDAEQVSADQKPTAADGTTNKLDITKGGGWFYNLPPDGSWVQWKTEASLPKGDVKNLFTMRCVGTVVIDGKRCRWIEFENHRTSSNGDDSTYLWKLLFPEKQLLSGERPMEHLVAGWKKVNGAPPRSIPIPFPQLQASAVRAALPGPLDDPQELKPEVVESKLGKLACRGVVGTRQVLNPNVRIEYRTRLHEKVPFGVVTQTVKTEFKRDGQVVKIIRTSKLVDFGTDAKSALPDKGYEPKEDQEDDSAETKVSTKARPTVAKATQTESEDKAVAALKDLGARIRFDDQGRVIHVNLMGKGQITETDLVHLKRLTELNNLQLSGPGITDAGLKNLRELAKLRRIWLVGTKITDAGLANLAGLTNLEILQFPQSKGITDEGLIHLKNLRKLKKLSLNAPGITDAGLKHLQGLSNLEHLGLDGTRISDAGLEELKDWKHLKELRISYTMVTDAGLRHLRERTDLTSLNVGGPKITNEGLAHLKGLVNLYWLLIAGSPVSDAGLKHLSEMTDLQYLWIQKTQISDDGLAHLAGMNKLESLWLLDNAEITDAGLEHLKKLRNLKSVTLQGTKVTQAGVDKLKKALPNCKIEADVATGSNDNSQISTQSSSRKTVETRNRFTVATAKPADAEREAVAVLKRLDVDIKLDDNGKDAKTALPNKGYDPKQKQSKAEQLAALSISTVATARNANSKDAIAYKNSGDAWFDKGDLRKALVAFNQAIRLDPNLATAYSSRGSLWRHNSLWDKALADFNEAIRLDPKLATAYSKRGATWYAKYQYDKAIADLNQAIRLDPKLVAAYRTRSGVLLTKGQFDKSISDCNEVIRLKPKDARAYRSRGLVWKAKGELDKAIEDYDEAIRLDPKDASAYWSRGKIWQEKGQFDKVNSDYNELLRLSPKNARAYQVVAWLQATCPVARYRDGRKAVENAKKAYELADFFRYEYKYIGTLAAAYAENGEFDEAVKWQEKAVLYTPAKQAEVRSRLDLYKSGKPFREKPKK